MTKSAAIALACLTLLGRVVAVQAAAADYFAIRVVDDQTGRGVPLAYLTTTYHARYVTDSAGYVAFSEPGLMDGRDVWFDVASYGYESPAVPFGTHGVRLKPLPGKSAEIRLKRTQIAERLYRLTGYGVYRDSVLLGKTPPVAEPLLNARVTGQDTVQTAVYHGKMLWLWQDTDRLGFSLGNFSMTGATSDPPARLDPDRGIDFTYFVDKPGEFVRPMADVPGDGPRPVWVDGLTVVPDAAGQERLVARYVVVNHDMSPHERGLVLLDDKMVLRRLATFDAQDEHSPAPNGHPVRVRDDGVEYAYYPGNVRVRADFANASDPSQYEGFTCLRPDGTADRGAGGALVWSWRRGGRPVDPAYAAELVKRKTIRRDESPFRVTDADTGKPVAVASGSVAWNAYLRRWTFLIQQVGGDSNLGEIWFATANSPEGPWTAARKVATHAMPGNNNDFYNPVQHDELQRENGRYVYFSGTFVNTFSGNPAPTPYYSYNNILYRLDLSDPRLKLPDPPPGLTNETPVG